MSIARAADRPRASPRMSCPACYPRTISSSRGTGPLFLHIPALSTAQPLSRGSSHQTLLVMGRSQVSTSGQFRCSGLCSVFSTGESPSNNANHQVNVRNSVHCTGHLGSLYMGSCDLGSIYIPFPSLGSCSSENRTLYPLLLKGTERV